MRDSDTPDGLTTILSQTDALVRQAFTEGYRQGVNETRDRMFRAAMVGVDQRLPVLRTGANNTSNPSNTLKRAPSSGPGRAQRNGTIIACVREALLNGGGVGSTNEELLTHCRNKGLDVTPASIKEAIRQLQNREEALRHRGMIYGGPRLRAHEEASEPAKQADLMMDQQ